MEKVHVSDIGVRLPNTQATSGTRTIMKNDTMAHWEIQFQEQKYSSEKFALQFSSPRMISEKKILIFILIFFVDLTR